MFKLPTLAAVALCTLAATTAQAGFISILQGESRTWNFDLSDSVSPAPPFNSLAIHLNRTSVSSLDDGLTQVYGGLDGTGGMVASSGWDRDGGAVLYFGPLDPQNPLADGVFSVMVSVRNGSLELDPRVEACSATACSSPVSGTLSEPPSAAVPEPASYGLAGLALLGCGMATTRRRGAGKPAAA